MADVHKWKSSLLDMNRQTDRPTEIRGMFGSLALSTTGFHLFSTLSLSIKSLSTIRIHFFCSSGSHSLVFAPFPLFCFYCLSLFLLPTHFFTLYFCFPLNVSNPSTFTSYLAFGNRIKHSISDSLPDTLASPRVPQDVSGPRGIFDPLSVFCGLLWVSTKSGSDAEPPQLCSFYAF